VCTFLTNEKAALIHIIIASQAGCSLELEKRYNFKLLKMKKTPFPKTYAADPRHLNSEGAIAIRDIFLAYYPRLAYFAENLLKDRQDAEDVASAALGKFWENLSGPGNARIDNIEGWLFKVVRNACYNQLKHRLVVQKTAEAMAASLEMMEHDIEAHLIEEDIINKLFQEIHQLPAKCKQVAELIYIQGYSPAEAGQKLGITPSTVRSQQARAVELIRAALIRKKIFIEPAIFLLFLGSLDRNAF